MEKILLIDDDPEFTSVTRWHLEEAGYRVHTAVNGFEALAAIEKDRIGLILLDVVLPQEDGYTVCQKIRHATAAPIVMLTGLNDEEERVRGLMAGADDYVAKPFSRKELLARIHAQLRRWHMEGPVYRIGPLHVDVARREVKAHNRRVHLTPIEFELLLCLIAQAGRVVTFEEILQRVWGYQDGNYNQVKVRIHHLRRKLDLKPDEAGYVTSVRGVGFTISQ